MKRKKIEEFDDAFEDGVFAFPPSPSEPKVKIKALGNTVNTKVFYLQIYLKKK
ncbi:hypothetical protein BkAM31D_09650 [Halalkalibacter krulwichiae]|uniref:Uncharacterized protein n=1 Tax=Halalkalibacter krulwichiae TaxID=199441 RepID=A0A1X9M9L9_9BACI|nr:hypothetical protein BkAM31D_09650 [Halalkalibacter krulwichiae]